MINLYLILTNQLFTQPVVLIFTISFLFYHFTQLRIILEILIIFRWALIFYLELMNFKNIHIFFYGRFTPEWIFNSKNHNWFGWQFGYNMKDVILKKSELQIEYNWTDQRIYMHKYDINDFYNHQHPLGFWAGPHAQELLFNYTKNFGNEFSNFIFQKQKEG